MDVASSFETSELLATLLTSTPLLSKSWRLCEVANRTAPDSFVTEKIGDIAYVVFSGIQTVSIAENDRRNLVPLNNGLFSPLSSGNENEEVPMVHAGLLNVFLSIFNHQNLQNQISGVIETSKSIIITGHSVGGAAASLCTLWLLSLLQSKPVSPPSVLCITFGSPLMGNDSLSRAILRERWGGKLCHVVSVFDVMPRLLLAPLTTLTPQINLLQRYWNLSMISEQHRKFATHLSEKEKSGFFLFVLVYLKMAAEGGGEGEKRLFWPFGNFLFCSEKGAICLENAVSIVKMMHLMISTGCPSDSFEDHLKYGDYVGKVSLQFLKKRDSIKAEDLLHSSYEASVALALESAGITESIAKQAKDCLKTARRMGLRPNLNSAKLAISLSNIVPYRVQIEWYKASCDKSDDKLGYYDSFKQRGASKKGFKVNMNRHKLARFWNEVIYKLENNHLPPDFHKRGKWINASHFYKLLVEPLDIAQHYRLHRAKGHYLEHGRERRYEIFDRWWRERDVRERESKKRSEFASLTQDSCFWARVEEARDWIDKVRCQNGGGNLSSFWKKIEEFEKYASRLVETKEVSKDVMAKNSSYSLWVDELRELRLQIKQFPRIMHVEF